MSGPLESLRQEQPHRVAEVLSGITSSLLPDPGIEEPGPATMPREHLNEFQTKVLHEVLASLHVNRFDPTPRTSARIYRNLTEAMIKAALPRDRVSAVKARLGQKGLLPPRQYRVAFANTFRSAEQLGVRRSHVTEALQQPDQVEHLTSDASEPGKSATEAVSLFSKDPRVSREQPFLLLILCKRKADLLEVWDAWRIYREDVAFQADATPLAILRQFIDTYGGEITVGGKTGKFFLHETIHAAVGEAKTEIAHGEGTGPTSIHMLTRHESGKVEVAVAFALDLVRYATALRRHGVTVTLPVNVANAAVRTE